MNLILLLTLSLIFMTGNLYASSLISLTEDERDFIIAHPSIILGSDKEWEPYVIEGKDGQISGYDADVLALINQVSGANFKLKLGQWKTITEAQRQRQIDGLSTAAISRKRAQHSLFSQPYLSLKKIIFTHENLPYSINNISDLKGKKFGIYSANTLARKTAESIGGVQIIEFESIQALIEGVTTGKADFMLGNAAMFHLLNKSGNPFLKPALFLSNSPLDLVFVIRNDYPEAISIINKSLTLIGKEKLLELKTKWFSSNKIQVDENPTVFSAQELNYISGKKQLNLCIDPNWMPLEKLENGKHIGMSADYFDIFRESLKIPIKLVKTKNWNQTLQYSRERKCDLISLAVPTKSRNKYLHFTQPLLETPVVLATKPHITFVSDLSLIKNKKIGIVKGYAFNEIIREQYPNIEVVDVDTPEQGLQKVVNGQLFGYIDALATVGYMFQTKFIGELKISGKFDQQWDMRIATRKDEPLLLSIMDKLIAQLPEEVHQEIFSRYVAINYEKGFDYKIFWQIMSIIAIISILFLYRYQTLTKYNRRIKRHLAIIDNHILTSSTNLEGTITDVSSALCKLTGYQKSELVGRNSNIFRHPKTPPSLYHSLWETITQGKVWQGEILNLNKNGSSFWVNTKITPTYYQNGSLRGYTAILHDISDKKRLEKLTVTDTLTQIPNRLFINNSYDNEFERSKRYNSYFSLILIDIDYFKLVNDKYGHKMGDDVLINIATILKQNIRQLDLLGRWGGEEFLIICPETRSFQAEIMSEKIREIIEQFEFSEGLKLTCSFGITESHPDDNKESVFHRADSALYSAKHAGRNRVIIENKK